MKLYSEQRSDDRPQEGESETTSLQGESNEPPKSVLDSFSEAFARIVSLPQRVPANVTRREGLKLAGVVAFSGGAVGAAGTARASEEIIAKDAAGYSPDGTPELLKVDKTDFTLSWDSLSKGETLIVEFKVSPTYNGGDFETIGSTAYRVDSESGSVQVTADDLFPGGEGDVTYHSAISIDDFAINTDGLTDPADSDLVTHRSIDVEIDAWIHSNGNRLDVIKTSFDVLYAVECGFGKNFGWIFGRKLPATYETKLASLNV